MRAVQKNHHQDNTNTMKKISVLLFFNLFTCTALADNSAIDIGLTPEDTGMFQDSISITEPIKPPIRPLTSECLKSVADHYGIHLDILFAILMVEGGTIGETSRPNKNGTKDLGLFQFNESNLPELKEMGITREEMMNDGCLNAAVAARHLLRSIQGQPVPSTRLEYLQMLSRYHSKTPDKNLIYATKLGEAFESLYASDEQSEYEQN